MLDAGSGQWKKLAPVPDGLAGALDSCGATCPTSPAATGDANHLFVYAGINTS